MKRVYHEGYMVLTHRFFCFFLNETNDEDLVPDFVTSSKRATKQMEAGLQANTEEARLIFMLAVLAEQRQSYLSTPKFSTKITFLFFFSIITFKH